MNSIPLYTQPVILEPIISISVLMFTFIPMNDVCFCYILSRLLAMLVQSTFACYTVLKLNNRHLSPCHTITDWGNGWVTDAWSSGTHPSMPVLSVTCAVMSVDVQHYHWWVLCIFKIANRQPTDNSPVVVRMLSVPTPFCSVLVHYLSNTPAVHI